jgi:hypothetical protein
MYHDGITRSDKTANVHVYNVTFRRFRETIAVVEKQ